MPPMQTIFPIMNEPEIPIGSLLQKELQLWHFSFKQVRGFMDEPKRVDPEWKIKSGYADSFLEQKRAIMD